ncbi:hypothetical protein FRX31_034625, partial [Thalictrum thalictroides]
PGSNVSNDNYGHIITNLERMKLPTTYSHIWRRNLKGDRESSYIHVISRLVKVRLKVSCCFQLGEVQLQVDVQVLTYHAKILKTPQPM